MDDFYVDGRGASEFGARLLADYTVGGAQLTRGRLQLAAGMRFVPLATRCGLRKISLTVDLYGTTPRRVQEQKSNLDAAFLTDPVELILPDGFQYTASLDSIGEVKELTRDGCVLEGGYKLSGFRHGPSETVTLPAGGGTLYASGTAPDMECSIRCTVGADTGAYLMAGVLWVNVSAGDALVLDGIHRAVLRNGENALNQCDLTRWPLLAPGKNVLTAPDPMIITYYPIYL
ncbi:MAG: hypothetical protein ACI4JC_02075 [Faecalibacterium sp.]